MENSAEFYYEKLKSSSTPGQILAALLGSSYDYNPTRSEVIMCNRLTKTFGRFIVFYSIIDMAGSYPEKPDPMYPLLYTICKRRFETMHHSSSLAPRNSLDGYLTDLQKQMEKNGKQKRKIPSPKGLE